jgi:hypothetical protein
MSMGDQQVAGTRQGMLETIVQEIINPDILDVLIWNIKDAGDNKADDPETMRIIKDKLRGRETFRGLQHRSLIFLQEVISRKFLSTLEQWFSEENLPYVMDYRRVGSGMYGEYDVCIYNTDRIAHVETYDYQGAENNDGPLFRRNPTPRFIVSRKGHQAVYFNMHTSPKQVNKKKNLRRSLYELWNLPHAFDTTRKYFSQIKYDGHPIDTRNYMVVGDLNEVDYSPAKISRLMRSRLSRALGMWYGVDFPSDDMATPLTKLLRMNVKKNSRFGGSLDHLLFDLRFQDIRYARIDNITLGFDYAKQSFLKGLFGTGRSIKQAKNYVSDHDPLEVGLYETNPFSHGFGLGLAIWAARASIRKLTIPYERF